MRSTAVVSVGGDGSLHYVACGLIEARLAGSSAVLGILPVGTGNDFARMVGMPGDPEKALTGLITSTKAAVDHGWLIWRDNGLAIRRPFVNCAGIGLDAKSAVLASRLKRFIGNLAYVAAPAIGVLGWRAPRAEVSIDPDGAGPIEQWRGRIMLASVTNGKWIGGGIKISPAAEIDDRALDLCLVPRLSIPRAYLLLPKAMKGQHEDRPEMIMRSVKRVRVSSDDPMPVYVDGEPAATSVKEATFEIAAGELPVLVPKPGADPDGQESSGSLSRV